MKPKNLCLVAAIMALSLVTGLLTPSGTAHAQVLPTAPHYDCYNIVPMGPQTLPLHLTLETQFGTEVVANAPNYTDLCLPAKKNGEGSLIVPHVECVPIAGALPAKIVRLETQWGIQGQVVVHEPVEACMPATKAIFPGTPSETVPTAPHYECYNIQAPRPSGAPTTVTVEDQFLPYPGELVNVGNPTRLCLAAKKNGVGDLNAPNVECFAITSGPTVNKVLNLLTQFPPVHKVNALGPPRELCMPVLKTELLVPGVGGTQGLPDTAESAAAAESSGGSSLPYAAIAGAAVGLVVVLGAGGWYARRRWLS
jgi:hypothetical protein